MAPSSPQMTCTVNAHSPGDVPSPSALPIGTSSTAVSMPDNLEEGTLALDLFSLLVSSYKATESTSNEMDSLQEFADVQLSFGNDLVISAHRAVLAARSQYFLSELFI